MRKFIFNFSGEAQLPFFWSSSQCTLTEFFPESFCCAKIMGVPLRVGLSVISPHKFRAFLCYPSRFHSLKIRRIGTFHYCLLIYLLFFTLFPSICST
jgi:hypothetical protein